MKTFLHHVTVNGLIITFPKPDPEIEAFLEEMWRIVDFSSYDELVGTVYGDRNPLLERSPLGVPWVTPAVAANPVFSVMRDILNRKHIAQRGDTPQGLATGYTLTANDAAEIIGISASAVRQAVAKGRLDVWMVNDEYRFHPKHVEQYARLRTTP